MITISDLEFKYPNPDKPEPNRFKDLVVDLVR